MSNQDRGGSDAAYYERRATDAPQDADDFTPIDLDGLWATSTEIIPWDDYNPQRFFGT